MMYALVSAGLISPGWMLYTPPRFILSVMKWYNPQVIWNSDAGNSKDQQHPQIALTIDDTRVSSAMLPSSSLLLLVNDK